MSKVLANTTKGLPLWYAKGNCYITPAPREVEDSKWLRNQAKYGLINLVEVAPTTVEIKATEPADVVEPTDVAEQPAAAKSTRKTKAAEAKSE